MFKYIRRYFISGLLVWIPIWVTLLVIHFVLSLLNNSFSMLPHQYQPASLIGFEIPGLGIIITVTVILLTGLLVGNFLGSRMVKLWDRLIDHIPFVRSIYAAVKQTLNTLVKADGQSFRRVLLVEYPRKGLYSIAFQTGDGCQEVRHALGGDPMVTIFIPTTPNPTSGFLMMIPESETKELNMSVEQALKFVISLGVVQPGFNPETGESLTPVSED